jgi:hypothetical protein
MTWMAESAVTAEAVGAVSKAATESGTCDLIGAASALDLASLAIPQVAAITAAASAAILTGPPPRCS